jgi:site-specific DNA-cytosine methylase
MGAATLGLPGGLVRVAGGMRELIARKRNKAILRAAGNSVVPQIVEAIGKTIMEVDEQ